MQEKEPLLRRIIERMRPKKPKYDIMPSEKLALPAGARNQLKDNLIAAATEGNARKTEILLDMGADANARDNYSDETVLMLAAEVGFADICALLIEKGANVKAGDEDGANPLMCAARNGHTKTCALLLEKGADIEAKENERHWTALMLAAYQGHTETCAFLLEKGADIEAGNREDHTALMLARIHGKKETAGFLAFFAFAPKIFADKEASDSFYSGLKECIQ